VCMSKPDLPVLVAAWKADTRDMNVPAALCAPSLPWRERSSCTAYGQRRTSIQAVGVASDPRETNLWIKGECSSVSD
jgi:hypothetical protein